MNKFPQRQIFFKKPRTNIARAFLWIFLIVAGLYIYRSIDIGTMQSPFEPTLTPTRTANSYALQGDALFEAGQIQDAITAYQQAVKVNPSAADIWGKLARIQAYASASMTTDEQRRIQLQEALASARKAVELAPEDSTAHAILAFVLDWNASPVYVGDEVQKYLTEAEREALRALTLDGTNTLALAYYAEILTDQQKLDQAQVNIEQAVQNDPSLMDVHRVYAYVLESVRLYSRAIEEYDKAIAISPNMTFLMVRAGAIYRHLQDYERSLEYFDKAASLNEQLGIKDPTPNLSIAKTYSQMGEFFSAARNVLKALQFDQTNADTYGQLGVVFFKSRNYEGSILPLKCAVKGCTPAESCEARNGCDENAGEFGVQVEGLDLSPNSVVYYYTYGSVLSALSRPQQNYCPEALDVFAEVRQGFGGDINIMPIVQAGEAICQGVAEKMGTPAPPQPSSTPSPSPTATP
jgi:tetratricopeptide (TPR) repeat protein